MNKNQSYKGVALILLLIIALPLIVSATPTQSQSFAGTQSNPYILNDGDTLFLNLNDFFSNYEIVQVGFFNPFGSGSIFLEENINDFTSSLYDEQGFEVGLYSFGDVVDLQLQNQGVSSDITTEISLYLISPTGQGISTSFYVEYVGVNTPPPPEPPTQTQSFVDYTIGFEDFVYLNLDNYYEGYDEVTLTFTDPDGNPTSQTLIQQTGSQPDEEYIATNFDVYLDSFTNSIIFDFISKTTERTITFDITATNNDGSTSTDTFIIDIVDDTPPPSGSIDFTAFNNKLLHYYDFDENTGTTATDSKGSNDGTINGASWVSGKINNGLSFDGVNDYITSSNNLDLTTSLTYNLWVKPTTNSGIQFIMHNWYDTGNQALIYITGGDYIVALYENIGNAKTINLGAVNINQWKMITLTHDGAIMRAYLDGVEVGSGLSVGTLESSNNLVGFGRRPSGIDFFNGLIDEVAIFDQALTTDEINFLYNEGNPSSDQQPTFTEESTPSPDPVTAPTVTEPIPNININYNNYNGFLVNDYFTDYDEVELAFTNNGNTVIIEQVKGTSDTPEYIPIGQTSTEINEYTGADFGVILHQTTNGVYVEFEGKTTDVNKEIQLAVYNTEGSVQQSFDLTINELVDETGLPSQTQSFVDLTREVGEELNYNLNDYFTNVNRYGVIITDKNTDLTVFETQLNSFTSLLYDDAFYDISIIDDDLTIIFKQSSDYEIKIRGLNTNGVRIGNPFTITVPEEDKGFIGNIFQSVTDLYPNSDSLSQPQRIGYTILTMFFVTVILGLGLSQSSIGLSGLSLMFIALFNFIILIYFIAIGYIGIGLIITLSLIALGLSYFRLRSNNVGGV